MKLRGGSFYIGFRTLIILCLALLVAAVAALLDLRLRHGREMRTLPSRSSLSHSDAWVAFGGEWTTNPVQVENNTIERGAKLMSRPGNWGDYQVQADIRLDSPYGIAGLIIRSSGEEEGVDAYHGYFAGIRPTDSSLEFGRADFGWRRLLYTPLPRINGDPGWIHLRVVAVGCRFGVALTFPSGQELTSSVDDPDCIQSGRFGLRSYSTSAAWRNIEVAPATEADLSSFPQANAPANAPDLFLASPMDPEYLDQYISSIRSEAKKHEIRLGVSPISDFPISPGRHPNVTIQGVVISKPPLVAIQDDTGAMMIRGIDPKVSLKLGDYVEAHGTVTSESFRSAMEDSQVRILWSDTPVPPLFVTASQLTSGTYRGRSIEVEGDLISATSHTGGYEFILRDGSQYFRATGSSDLALDSGEFKLGSRVRLKGIATSLSEFTNDIYPFDVVTERVDLIRRPPWRSPVHVLWLTLTCIALFIGAQVLLHGLQKWHMRSVLMEREELAFEIHDTLAQSFTGIAYQLQAASMERSGLTKVQTHIQNALQLVQMSHKEASRTIAALRPQLRDAGGILTALKESAERVSDGSVRITTMLSGRSTQLPLEITDMLFRVGQEAISNAMQYAGCSQLAIALRLSKREAQLSIEDDGRGFSEQPAKAGVGITAMRSRAAKTKARFELETEPGAGVKITVTAPLPLGYGLLSRLRAKIGRTFTSSTRS